MRPLSLYGQYIKERQGRGIVETEDGFATFDFVSAETVYIVDLYVIPEKRTQKVASSIANKVVEESKKLGYKYLLGSVDTRDKNADRSIKVLEGYGMKFYKSQEPMIFFAKSIKDPEQIPVIPEV